MANEFRIKNGAISPNMVITDTNVSTSTATGALQVAGGAGIVGNVYASAFYGAATGLTSIPGANVSGAVPSATSAGTVTTAAQPNITSVGTLTSLTSSGQIQINASNGKIALVTTNGGHLGLGLEDGNASTPMISFKTGNMGFTTVRLIASGGNVAFGRGNLEILSANTTFTSGNVYASAFYGAATGLTSIPGANVTGSVPSATSATTASTVTTNAQPNITSVGSLTSLTVAGNVTVASGIPFVKLVPTIPQIELGRTDGTASFPKIVFWSSTSTAPSYDSRIYGSGGNGTDGSATLIFNSGANDFLGGRIRVVSNFGNSSSYHCGLFNDSSYITFYPKSTAGTFNPSVNVGDNSLIFSNGTINDSEMVIAPFANIASGIRISVSGQTTYGNISATGSFVGNASGLTSIPGANVTGSVPSATIASTVTTNAQPNITSVGSTLSVASSLLIGRIDNTASTPTIEFNSGATSVDYDARILCSGGNGANDGGDLAVTASTFYIGAKFGYRTGMGLSVTQLTSRTTSVTINAPVGRITLVSATTTAGQISSFTVNNSYINSTDVVMFSKFSGSGYYIISTRSLAVGSFVVDVYTPVAVTSAEAPAFNFAIIRGTLS